MRTTEKRAICSSHSALSDAGETTSTRSMPRSLCNRAARRDCLHGFAEAHVVGEQSAFPKRQVKHAVDLIRQQRLLEQGRVRNAVGQSRLEAVMLALPAPARPPRGNPALQPARDAQAVLVGAGQLFQGLERPLRAPAQVGVEPFGILDEGSSGVPDRWRRVHAKGASAALVQKDLDTAAGRAAARMRPPPRGQTVDDPFDVLAASQLVDAEIPALARVDALAERADLDHVAAAARRPDAIVAERMAVLAHRVHFVDLGAAAPLTTLDLVLVGRDPAVQRRRPLARPSLASCFRRPS